MTAVSTSRKAITMWHSMLYKMLRDPKIMRSAVWHSNMRRVKYWSMWMSLNFKERKKNFSNLYCFLGKANSWHAVKGSFGLIASHTLQCVQGLVKTLRSLLQRIQQLLPLFYIQLVRWLTLLHQEVQLRVKNVKTQKGRPSGKGLCKIIGLMARSLRCMNVNRKKKVLENISHMPSWMQCFESGNVSNIAISVTQVDI